MSYHEKIELLDSIIPWREVHDMTKTQIDDENTKWIRDQMIFNQPGEFK